MYNNQPIAVSVAERLATLAAGKSEALLVGICGMQGVGKTTFCRHLAELLVQQHKLRVAQLSIDDFYLSHHQRTMLAEKISPLLQTRGVPGTHDKEKMLQVLQQLKHAAGNAAIRLPRFDKATDNPLPENQQSLFEGKPSVILFEGWCVGAVPQLSVDNPCNDLERFHDTNATWRTFVNRQLYAYQPVFELIDFLIYIAAPSFEQARLWRYQQEQDLQQANANNAAAHIMTYEELLNFMAHYERISNHIAATMPEYADMVLAVNPDHSYRIRCR